MKAIAVYEQEKAKIKAEKAAKKKSRMVKKAKKQQSGAQDVVDMVVQEILAAQTPSIQFYDQCRSPITRSFKPPASACKAFMQVRPPPLPCARTHTSPSRVPVVCVSCS